MKKEYLTYLKEALLLNENKPDFYRDNFYYNVKDIFNCYAYAMGFKLPKEYISKYNGKNRNRGEDTVKFKPGFTCKETRHYNSSTELIEHFCLDCDSLELPIKKSNIYDKNRTDGYRVALYCNYICDEIFDFHFVRQNKDLSWSHKTGYIDEPKKINITSFLKTDKALPEYKLVGCYEVCKPYTLVKR